MTEVTVKLSTALADRYQIERHLGEGGMANVYLAEDLKHERNWRPPEPHSDQGEGEQRQNVGF